MFNDLNDYCDTVLEESYGDDSLYLEEGYYDVEELCEACINILENKADIARQNAARRYADRMSGNHEIGKFMHDSIYKYGDSHNKDMSTAKDFKDRNKINNRAAKALTKTDKYFDKKRDKNIKRSSNGKEIKKDARHAGAIKTESAYDEVNDLFNFDII